MVVPIDADISALAAIRPGDPMQKVADAVGERWRVPEPVLSGKVLYLKEDFDVDVQLDREGNVGKITFDQRFNPTVMIDGLRLGMSEDDMLAAIPNIRLTAPSQMTGPYRFGSAEIADGVLLSIQMYDTTLSRITYYRSDAVYADKGPLPLPKPSTAYGISVVPGLCPRDALAPDGWSCGLPRGITPSQWPLSNDTGFPLEHYFTVRVPESYRVKGQQYVALAFFGEGEQFKSAPEITALMNIMFDGRSVPNDVDTELRPFLDHLRQRHPMEFRSKDILSATFAAIWLTESEFSGSPCEPPQLVVSSLNEHCARPDWLQATSAQRLFGWNGKEDFNQDYWLHRLAGHKPQDEWELLLLEMQEIEGDPNVGRQPVDTFSTGNPDGYVPKYSEEWDALDIELPSYDLRFGGTVSPVQAMPDLTTFFIEFEESMGQMNMGGGNGQLDLMSMQVDWACG